MFHLKTLILSIIGLNCIGLILMLIQNHVSKPTRQTTLIANTRTLTRFENPVLAYHILKELDKFEPVNDSYFTINDDQKSFYDYIYFGIDADDNYCDITRGYFVDYPEVALYETNILVDHPEKSITKKIINKIGYVINPKIYSSMPKSLKENRSFKLNPKTNIFYTNVFLHYYVQLGKQFSCLTQEYNHIPGTGTLFRRDLLIYQLRNYTQYYTTKFSNKNQSNNINECFDQKKFMPASFVLKDKAECEFFFDYLIGNSNNSHFDNKVANISISNDESYNALKLKQGIVFIKKLGRDFFDSNFVDIIDDTNEKLLLSTYDSGKKCGFINDNIIIERYISNPLLVHDGHKFDLRVFMLIASTNPLIVYYYPNGIIRSSLYKYKEDFNIKNAHLTNKEIPDDILKIANESNGWRNMTISELYQLRIFDFEKLQDILLKENKIKEKNWLNDYLRPAIIRSLIHLIRMAQNSFLKRSSTYELLAVDFILDNDMNLWYLESNPSPTIKQSNMKIVDDLMSQMLIDHFDIVLSYLRSRIKRIIYFVNSLLDRNDYTIEDNMIFNGVYIPNYDLKYRQFRRITMNYIDNDFKISINNQFYKIIDENLHGVLAYNNFIEKKCIFE